MAAAMLLFGFATTVFAQTSESAPASGEARIEQLEREVAALREALDALRAQQAQPAQQAQAAQQPAAEPRTTTPAPAPAIDTAELARRIDLLAAEVERMKLGETAVTTERSEGGFGPAASKVYRAEPGISIGGYGEVTYHRIQDETDETDMLRSVVYVGYKFDDKWLFNSELEFEHGGDETGIEFAYLDYAWRPELGLRFGHLLMPMGFLNELHEPTTFLGVDRPLTERVILPSTWHENGVGIFGETGGVSYRSYVVNGFDATGFSAEGLREGRQGGAEAKAEDLAWVTRLEGTPVEGLRLGGSAYLGKAGQDLDLEGPVDVATRIFELHGEWRVRGLELRALAARAWLDDVRPLDAALGLHGSDSIGEELRGQYVQLGYDVLSHRGNGERQLIPFVRWEQVDTQHEVPSELARNPANDREVLTYGLSWLPKRQLVFKLDFQDFEGEAGSGGDRFNLGVGYVF